MSKKETTKPAAEKSIDERLEDIDAKLKEQGQDEALPDESELEFGDEHSDSSLFFKFEGIGENFIGAFIRKVAKGGNEGLKYPGLLFAKYPNGELQVLPDNWSIAEEIANQEQQNVDLSKKLISITLKEIKVDAKDPSKSVKLFAYRYANAPRQFTDNIKWNDQFRKNGE